MDEKEKETLGEDKNFLSRDGSYISLNSDSTSYYTARESFSSSQSQNSGGNLKQTPKNEETSSSINSSSSLATLEDHSFPSDTEEENEDDDDVSKMFEEVIQLSETKEEIDKGFRLKADVSKICNEIAEAIQPDTKKKAEINLAISNQSKSSINELRKLAISEGGLLSNVLRKLSWPALLGISKKEIESSLNKPIPTQSENVSQQIQNLVNMDVARVLKRFPPGLSDPQQDHLQTYLSTMIISVLNNNPDAYYYQGFHDISLTFLLVSISQDAPYLAYLSLNKMIETCLSPFMEKTMDSTHDLIHVLFAIIEKEDSPLFNKIVKESKCPAAFSLPWILTWFSHTLPNDNDVFRVYDFILGCLNQIQPPYLVPIFLSASLILRNSSKIQSSVQDKDIATMHHALAMLPSQEPSLELWLKDSLKLMNSFKGKEMQLVGRAVHIKELQNELWDEVSRDRRTGSVRREGGLVSSVGKFVFIKHRWYTVAVIVLGAAYLLQSKYGPNFHKELLSLLESYVPEKVRRVYTKLFTDLEFDGFI